MNKQTNKQNTYQPPCALRAAKTSIGQCDAGQAGLSFRGEGRRETRSSAFVTVT